MQFLAVVIRENIRKINPNLKCFIRVSVVRPSLCKAILVLKSAMIVWTKLEVKNRTTEKRGRRGDKFNEKMRKGRIGKGCEVAGEVGRGDVGENLP